MREDGGHLTVEVADAGCGCDIATTPSATASPTWRTESTPSEAREHRLQPGCDTSLRVPVPVPRHRTDFDLRPTCRRWAHGTKLHAMVGREHVAWITSPRWRSEPLEYDAPDLLLLASAAGDASFPRDAQREHRLHHPVSVCGTSSDRASSQARLRGSRRLVSGEVKGRGLQ
jgi:hypothetical protein